MGLLFTHLANNRIHNHTAKCAGDVCMPVLLSHMCDHFEYNCVVWSPCSSATLNQLNRFRGDLPKDYVVVVISHVLTAW